MYAGYGAFLLRDLPFDAIEFVAYEQLRKAAAKWLQRDPNPVEVSLVGAAAGGFTGKCSGGSSSRRAACCARNLLAASQLSPGAANTEPDSCSPGPAGAESCHVQ